MEFSVERAVAPLPHSCAQVGTACEAEERPCVRMVESLKTHVRRSQPHTMTQHAPLDRAKIMPTTEMEGRVDGALPRNSSSARTVARVRGREGTNMTSEGGAAPSKSISSPDRPGSASATDKPSFAAENRTSHHQSGIFWAPGIHSGDTRTPLERESRSVKRTTHWRNLFQSPPRPGLSAEPVSELLEHTEGNGSGSVSSDRRRSGYARGRHERKVRQKRGRHVRIGKSQRHRGATRFRLGRVLGTLFSRVFNAPFGYHRSMENEDAESLFTNPFGADDAGHDGAHAHHRAMPRQVTRRRSSSFLDGLGASLSRAAAFDEEAPQGTGVYRHLYRREPQSEDTAGEGVLNDVSIAENVSAHSSSVSECSQNGALEVRGDTKNTDIKGDDGAVDMRPATPRRGYEQAQLLLVSLLDNFCALYDRDPGKNRRLFQAVCRRLHAMGVLTTADFFTGSESLRGIYKTAFRSLVREAIEGLDAEARGLDSSSVVFAPDALPERLPALLSGRAGSSSDRPDSVLSDGSTDLSSSASLNSDALYYSGSTSPSMSSSSSHAVFSLDTTGSTDGGAVEALGVFDAIALRHSRLRTEFEDLHPIGRGGFAHVLRGTHRLDGRHYAFKRIHFRSADTLHYAKIIREVKSLAALEHAHIVRYHGAWVERVCFDAPERLGSSLESSWARPVPITAGAQRKASLPHIALQAGFGSVHPTNVGPMSFAGADALLRTGAPGAVPIPRAPNCMAANATNYGNAARRRSGGEPTDGFYMYIQMELCQLTLGDWLEQRNFLISHGRPWRPEDSARPLSPDVASSRLCVPPERLAVRVEVPSAEDAVSGTRPERSASPTMFEGACARRTTWAVHAGENRRIFKCIVRALLHIHRSGVIHRDLKPGNILFQASESALVPKIGDFGLASVDALEALCAQRSSVDSAKIAPPCAPFGRSLPHTVFLSRGRPGSLSAAGASPVERGFLLRADDDVSCSPGVNGLSPSTNSLPSQSICVSAMHTTGLGTCMYAAPEQINRPVRPGAADSASSGGTWEREAYDEKVDIYSLGIILFELFHPFGTRMERQAVLGALKDTGTFPADFVQRWPKEAAFIWSCLSRDAAQRPSASEILASELLEQDPETTIERLSSENCALKRLLDIEKGKARALEDSLARLALTP